MSTNNISIVLDNPSGIYAPGSILSGTVLVTLIKPKKSRHITLHASGHAKTSFSRTYNDLSNPAKIETIPYSCERLMLDYCTPLWKASNGNKEELPAGLHRYKFSFGIPWDALPNWEGCHGHIRYNIKAEMHLSWQFNLSTEKSFYVMSIMDSSASNQPVKGFLSQTGTFSSSKVVRAEITLPKKVYACGEEITVSVVIDNHSGTSIDSIETGVKTEACYNGKNKFSVCARHATEHECFNSFSRTDSINIPNGGHDLYRRTFTISKQLPTITDSVMVVKHFVYVRIFKKGLFSSSVSQTIPIILTTARLEPIQIPPKLVIPTAPTYAEEEAIVNSLMGGISLSSSSRDLQSNSLYPSTTINFRPSSVPDDYLLMETFGAPPTYNEIGDRSSSSNASAPPLPPNYDDDDEIFQQKF